MMSSVAAALVNNGAGTVGVSPNAKIFPVRIRNTEGTGGSLEQYPTDARLIEGIMACMANNVRIINLSYNKPGNLSYANLNHQNPVLQSAIKHYHQWGGLIFCACRSDEEAMPKSPYIIMVDGISKSGNIVNSSGVTKSTWFVAPGWEIYCTNEEGQLAKFPMYGGQVWARAMAAAPMVAGIASLVWGANPSLTNKQVEQILIQTATPPSGAYSQYMGYGLPDAYKAVKEALGN